MTTRPVQIGDILLLTLPQQIGHEQSGRRPCVVVGIPDKLGVPRFPILIVAPLTTAKGTWLQTAPELYPVLPAGSGGLHVESVVLLDQIRAAQESRIESYIGSLKQAEYEPIRYGVRKMFDLGQTQP